MDKFVADNLNNLIAVTGSALVILAIVVGCWRATHHDEKENDA